MKWISFTAYNKILLNIIIAIVSAAENFIWIPGVIFTLQFFGGVEYFFIMCLQYVFLLVRKYHAYLCVSMQDRTFFKGKKLIKTCFQMISEYIKIASDQVNNGSQWIYRSFYSHSSKRNTPFIFFYLFFL